MDKPDLASASTSVNRLRAEHGIGEPLTEMPKGQRCKPDGCLIANALETKVYGARRLRGEEVRRYGPRYRTAVFLPPILSDASYAFDNGAYPELIA